MARTFWDVTVSEVREAFGGQDIPAREFLDFWNSMSRQEQLQMKAAVLKETW